MSLRGTKQSHNESIQVEHISIMVPVPLNDKTKLK